MTAAQCEFVEIGMKSVYDFLEIQGVFLSVHRVVVRGVTRQYTGEHKASMVYALRVVFDSIGLEVDFQLDDA